MAAWIWVLIPLVAIIGGFIIEYQKNKMTMMNRSRQNEEEVNDLRKLLNSLKNRIENLEAIAAQNPSEFKMNDSSPRDFIEIEDEESLKEENKRKVAEQVKTKGD